MEFLPEIVLTVLSIFIIPGIVQIVRIWGDKFNPEVGLQKQVVTVLAFALSLVAAFIWSGTASLPPFAGDPVEWMTNLLMVGSAFFTAVKLVYDFILKAIFERLGWSV